MTSELAAKARALSPDARRVLVVLSHGGDWRSLANIARVARMGEGLPGAHSGSWGHWSPATVRTRCGVVSHDRRRMYIHHIEGFDARPDLRTDPNNLCLLCTRCHANEHKAAKRGDAKCQDNS